VSLPRTAAWWSTVLVALVAATLDAAGKDGDQTLLNAHQDANSSNALGASAPWMDAAWNSRLSITADPALISGDASLAGFPLLITLDGAIHPDVFDRARPDGSDIRLTLGDGVTAPEMELVSYDGQARKAELWIRVPAFSKSENQFFLYYGNAIATANSTTDVWADYAAVYHFDENPAGGSLRDSSPAQAHAAAIAGAGGAWTGSDLVEGQIGRGWHYDGREITSTSSIYIPQRSWTTSAWLYLDDRGTDFFLQGSPCFFHFSAQASNVSHNAQYQNGYCGGHDWRWFDAPMAINEWHHWAWALSESDSSITFYYDGEEKPLWLIIRTEKWHPHGVGNQAEPVGVLSPMFFNDLDPMNGVGDEFRLQAGLRTPQWIATEYRNQKDPLHFFAYGPPESVAVRESSWGQLKSHY
jgi:hypothetical protein